MDVSIEEFLRRGVFGELSLGATEQDVVRILGAPDRFADFRKPVSLRIAGYNAVEMTYICDALVGISIDFPVRHRRGSSSILFPGHFSSERVSVEEFKKMLAAWRIPYVVDQPRSFPEAPVLATGERGTRVFFMKNRVSSIALTDDDAFKAAGRSSATR